MEGARGLGVGINAVEDLKAQVCSDLQIILEGTGVTVTQWLEISMLKFYFSGDGDMILPQLLS